MSMRRMLLAGLLTLSAAPLAGQEQDRHAARREWLARRRAGELADTMSAARASTPPKATSPAAGAPVPGVSAPHRFADRFTPNHEAPARGFELWPLEPLYPGWTGGPGYGHEYGGYGSAYRRGYPKRGAPWSWPQYRWWSSMDTCARVSVSLVPGGRYTLYLLLPPASPYDPAELELLLDRQLSAGQALTLQSAEGLWVRVHPGSRIEDVGIGECAGDR